MSQHREIKVPPLGESVSEAAVARWLKNAGDVVKVDELLVELETDKVTLEVTAPAAGLLYEIMKPVGTTVEAGQILGKIAVGEGVEDAVQAFTPPMPQEKKIEITEVIIKEEKIGNKEFIQETIIEETIEEDGRVDEFMAPAARKLAEENQLDPRNIPGTGKDGRITKTDVLDYLQMTKAPPPPAQRPMPEMAAPRMEVPAPKPQPVVVPQGDRREERVRMTRLRQRIAERLKHAQNTAAILTTFNEIDMTAVFNLRKEYKDAFEKKHGVRLGFMSFFVKAAIQALKDVPVVNSEIDGDEIIYKNYYDIGVAVSAPQGLVVPVIRDADQKSFAELEKEIAALGQKARDGKLTIEEMLGGTFTISNGGVFGSLMATPILNPPQSGILGMHKVEERPVAINGRVEIRPMMYVALSYDHRIIDGRESVTFLVRIKEYVENPERLLLDV